MVERKVRKIEDLANCSKPLEQSKHYEMIMRFGGNQDFKADVRRYNEDIIERNNAIVSQPTKKTQNSIKKSRTMKYVAIGILSAVAVAVVIILALTAFIPKSEEKASENIKKNKIVMVAAGDNHIVALKEDGTVVAVGSNSSGQCNVNDWRDIVAISVGLDHTVGLKSDGTVVATGMNEGGQCVVQNWNLFK